MPTVVDSLYDEFKALRDLLSASGEISLQSSADATFRKTLLLAAASYFETQVLDALLAFCAERTRDDELLLAFVKNQALTVGTIPCSHGGSQMRMPSFLCSVKALRTS